MKKKIFILIFGLSLIAGGCTKEQEYAPVYVVNSFTPNQDGVNEIWRIFSISDYEYKNFELEIFADNFQRIYYTTEMQQGWNGTIGTDLAPAGSYHYVSRFSAAVDGIQEYHDYTISGTLQLIR